MPFSYRNLRGERINYVPRAPRPLLTMSSTNKSIVRKIAQKVNNKNKQFEIATANSFPLGSPVAGTPLVARCSGTVQGDADGNRTGNEIHLKSWSLRLRLAVDVAQTATSKLRIIAFQDMQQAGSVPTGAQLLQDYAGDSTDYMKHINRTSIGPSRFKILYDKIHSLTPETLQETAAGAFTSRPLNNTCDKSIRIFKKFKGAGRKIRYIGTTNAQASDGNGFIYVMFLTNSTANGPDIDSCNEIKFYDA